MRSITMSNHNGSYLINAALQIFDNYKVFVILEE